MKKRTQSRSSKAKNAKRTPKKSPNRGAMKADTSRKNEESRDIVDLILRDHKPLKKMIETLKDPDVEMSEKEPVYGEFAPLLIAHAHPEQQSLYERMKDDDELRMEAFEAETEHEIADSLISEINGLTDEDVWMGKVKVLAELVEHHIEEEEDELLGSVKEELDEAERMEIGDEYLRLRAEFDLDEEDVAA